MWARARARARARVYFLVTFLLESIAKWFIFQYLMENTAITNSQQTLTYYYYFDTAISYIVKTPAEVLIIAIAGIALQIIFPVLAPPFFALSLSLLLTKLVVKITDSYNKGALEDIKNMAYDYEQRYPKAPIITFLFSLAVAPFSQIVGCALAIALGIISGLAFEIKQCKVLQNKLRVVPYQPLQPCKHEIMTR